jgi:hypothetical protein
VIVIALLFQEVVLVTLNRSGPDELTVLGVEIHKLNPETKLGSDRQYLLTDPVPKFIEPAWGYLISS